MSSLSIQQLPKETSPSPYDLTILEKITGDARTSDGVILAGSLSTLSSASGAFTLADNGLIVSVEGAGSGGADLISVVTYVSPTELTLTTAASQAVAGADVKFPVTKYVEWRKVPPAISYSQETDSASWGPFVNPYARPVNVHVEDSDGNPQTCLSVYNEDYSTIEIHCEPAFSGTVWLLP